jgi:hypothetical protein
VLTAKMHGDRTLEGTIYLSFGWTTRSGALLLSMQTDGPVRLVFSVVNVLP